MHCNCMEPIESSVKKKRTILSFEADPDVVAMIDKAKLAGLTQTEILNEAIRDCGPRVIKTLAEKMTKKLSSLSFNQPELQMAGFAE